MVQDREKLREVGLKPDRPAGHIRAIWALTLILAFAIVIAGGIYFILWYSPWGETTSWYRQENANDTKNWETFIDWNYIVSVKYPQDWSYKVFSVKSKDPNNHNAQLMVSFYEKDKAEQVKNSTAIEADSVPGDIFLLIDASINIDEILASLKGCEVSDKTIAQKQGKYVIIT